MTRYLIFGGERYYPTGGAFDLIGSADTLEEATEIAKGSTSKVHVMGEFEDIGRTHEIEWCHVLDVETMSIVLRNHVDALGQWSFAVPASVPFGRLDQV